MDKNECVDQKLPQLMRLLLAPFDMDDTYDDCLDTLTTRLKAARAATPSQLVWQTLNQFLDRFESERLEMLGQTFRALANVVIDSEQCEHVVKWTFLEFLLSVNYCAFRYARIHYEELMTKGTDILNAIRLAIAENEHVPDQNNDDAQDDANDSGVSESETLQQTEYLSADEPDFDDFDFGEGHLQPTRNPSTLETRVRIVEALSPQPEDESTQVVEARLDCNLPFILSYRKYLKSHLKKMDSREQETIVVYEIISMFIFPESCHYFVADNTLIKSRAIADCTYVTRGLIVKFDEPLQQMQLLQLFINALEQEREERAGGKQGPMTWIGMINGLRYLIKPIIESLIYYERCVTLGTQLPNLTALRQCIQPGLERLKILDTLVCGLTMPKQLSRSLYLSSFRIIFELLKATSEQKKPVKGCAAALLVHVLRPYCQLLDNFWCCGDFNDTEGEFLARRLILDERSKYKMRQVNARLRNCQVYKLLQRHIRLARGNLSLLRDADLLHEFVLMHGDVLNRPLYDAFVADVWKLVEPYCSKPFNAPVPSPIPDIFQQLQATKCVTLRACYFSYFKESATNFPDRLLSNFLTCASYTPLTLLICAALRQQLDQRLLLSDTYITHQFRDHLKLGTCLMNLRSIYLLVNFSCFSHYFVEAVEYLQREQYWKVSKCLLEVIGIYAPRLQSKFKVRLPSRELDDLILSYTCPKALTWIITDDHIQLYNRAYRLLLRLNLAAYKLEQLPELPTLEVLNPLRQLHSSLLQELHVRLHGKMLRAAAVRCDKRLPLCTNLTQLQNLHKEFLGKVSKCVLANSNSDAGCYVQELSAAADIVEVLWRRLLKLLSVLEEEEDKEGGESGEGGEGDGKNKFVIQFQLEQKRFLSSTAQRCKAMQTLLPIEVK